MNENPDVVPPMSNNPVDEPATTVVNTIEDCPNDGPCLLCISDLEGCGTSSINSNNHTLLCQENVFAAIKVLLKKNKQLRVAFLGDYFDLGQHMVKSINGIIDVFEYAKSLEQDKEYENEKDRVYIILGNRDVNKLRVGVENRLLQTGVDLKISDWSLKSISNPTDKEWFNNETNGKLVADDNKVTKTNGLLLKTYGAGDLLKNLAKEINGQEVSIDDESKMLEVLTDIFNTVSTNESDKFKQNVRKLFFNGKLIEIIPIGDNNVLASHGGTYTLAVYDQTLIKTTLPTMLKNKNLRNSNSYFGSIENFRKALELTNENTITVTVKEAIKFYNNTFKTFIQEIVDENGNCKKSLADILISLFNNTDESVVSDENKIVVLSDLEIANSYFLMQALGLKSTVGGMFASPIESCGGGDCLPINPMSDEFIVFLTINEVKCVAHGHKTMCSSVPLMYKQTTQDDKVIHVISCDTSNGYRSDNVKNLNEVPLAIIYEKSAGITSIAEVISDEISDKTETDANLSNTNTNGNLIKGSDNKNYKGMIGNFKFENFPKLTIDNGKGTEVTYENLGIFKFNTKYTAANFEPFKDYTAAVGGKRKTRRHKITKNKNKRNNKKGKTLRNKKRTIRKR
jgi:hypothetical protein